MCNEFALSVKSEKDILMFTLQLYKLIAQVHFKEQFIIPKYIYDENF